MSEQSCLCPLSAVELQLALARGMLHLQRDMKLHQLDRLVLSAQGTLALLYDVEWGKRLVVEQGTQQLLYWVDRQSSGVG